MNSAGYKTEHSKTSYRIRTKFVKASRSDGSNDALDANGVGWCFRSDEIAAVMSKETAAEARPAPLNRMLKRINLRRR